MLIPVGTENPRRDLNFPSERPPWLVHEIRHTHPLRSIALFLILILPVRVSDSVSPFRLKQPPVVIEIRSLAPQQHRFVVRRIHHRHSPIHLRRIAVAAVHLCVSHSPDQSSSLRSESSRRGAVRFGIGGPGLVVRRRRHQNGVVYVVGLSFVVAGHVQIVVARQIYDSAGGRSARRLHRLRRSAGGRGRVVKRLLRARRSRHLRFSWLLFLTPYGFNFFRKHASRFQWQRRNEKFSISDCF